MQSKPKWRPSCVIAFAISLYLCFRLYSCVNGDERDDYDPGWGRDVIAAGKPLVGVIERFEREFGRVPKDAAELVAYAPNAIPDAPSFRHWVTCKPGFNYSGIDNSTYLLWVYGYPGLASETDGLVYHPGAELPFPTTPRYLTVEVEPNWVYIVGFGDYTQEFRIERVGTTLPPSTPRD